MKLTPTLFVAGLLLSRPSAEAQKFYPDDPIQRDNDTLDTPEKPAAIELGDLYDRVSHIAKEVGSSEIGSEARNVNTLDEVPDSNWFTNRHGANRMSLDELRRGANVGGAPNPEETWTVFKGKSQGLTPGFEILDSKGDRYVIKLDPLGIPELSTAAEAIATKIFYAIGYNTPANYIVRFHPDNFAIQEGTQVEDSFGDEQPLTEWRLRRMIRRVPRAEDGTIRVTASKYISGTPIGPFRYYETRSDDPNDIISHEDRRELRGLRLFAAWTNHDDTRAQNTQSTWIEEDGKHFVRHYLLDFGSTFGSGPVDMQFPNLSFTYWLDLSEVKKNTFGFGFRVPQYRHVKWPPYPEYQSVGRWEGEAFDCLGWRNDYPNPAFVRMTPRDAFWAAKIIMRFTREELEAIVETGEYRDSNVAQYFLDVFLQRQAKCGEAGINGTNPLDDFRISGRYLEFTNLSKAHGFVDSETRYSVSWSLFDNRTGAQEALRSAVTQSETRSELPERPRKGPDAFLMAEIRSLNTDFSQWDAPIAVYLRPVGSSYHLAGIDRGEQEKEEEP